MAGSPWGGSEELWYRSALLALRRGWKVGCVVYHWKGKEAKMQVLAEAGAEIIWLPNRGRAKRNLIERLQNKWSKRQTRRRIAQLPFAAYDRTVINGGAFEITTPEWRWAYALPKRPVLLFHNYREGEVFRGAMAEAIRNWTSRSSLNLFASRRIPEVLNERSGIDVPRAAVLLNPITFSPPAAPTPYPPMREPNRFVMLAALDVGRKAQDALIRALAREQWKARSWTLHLYGEGPDRPMLEALIREQGLQDRVFLEGHSREVRGVLESAHLLLQVTHIDAMPLSVVEALALARPVVVSRIGDMPHWVQEGVNGWISEDASEASIDHTLERAWAGRERWEEMGRRAFSEFQQRFPVSVEADFLEKISGS